jgi:hypothetical protein
LDILDDGLLMCGTRVVVPGEIFKSVFLRDLSPGLDGLPGDKTWELIRACY